MNPQGISCLGGITLIPSDVMQEQGILLVSTKHLQIYDAMALCTIRDYDMFYRIHGVLTGIIAQENLNTLYMVSLLSPMALTIMRCYRFLTGNQDQAAWEVEQSIQQMCMAEALKPPPEEKGKMLFYVNKFALHTACPAKLRLDEDGRSICSGQIVIDLQFFCIEILNKEAARVWFRHPIDETLMITMDLSGDEMPDLDTRLDFGQQGCWRLGTGLAKPILQRARLDTKAKILTPMREAVPCDMGLISYSAN